MRPARVATLGIVVFTVAFAAALAVTRAVDDDARDDTAEPDTTVSVPVLAPIASGTNASTAIRQIGAPVLESDATLSSVVGEYTDGTPPVAEPRVPSLPELVAGSAPRTEAGIEAADAITPTRSFVDPCAGESPGAGSFTACEGNDASTGMGGTIVPAGLSWLWVEVVGDPVRLDGLDPQWRRCEYPREPRGGAPIVVVTSEPVDALGVTTRRSRDAVVGPLQATYDAQTSDTERSRYEEQGYDADRWYRNVQHCLRVDEPGAEPVAVRAFASVAEPAKRAFSSTQWLVRQSGNSRPPVRISFTGANTMHVVTPVRSTTGEATTVTVLRADGSDGPRSCGEFDANPLATVDRLRAQKHRSVGNPARATPFTAPGGTDRGYDRLLTHSVRVASGTPWFVCITWSTNPESLDASLVSAREQWRVTSPNRPRISLWLDAVDVARPAEGSSVRAEIAGTGCTAAMTIDDGRIGRHTSGVKQPLCDTPALADDPRGNVEIAVTLDRNEPTRSRIVFDPTATNRVDMYAIGLTRARRLCGSSPFGTSCDNHPDEAGRALVRVQYETPIGLPRGGSTMPDGEYDVGASGAPIPGPDRPQLDLTRSHVQPGADVSDLTVTLVPSEPVDVHAFVSGSDATGAARPCVRDGATGDARTRIEAGQTGTVQLTGLCAGTPYAVIVEMTGAFGRVATYAPWGTAMGTDQWNGYSATNEYRARVNVHLVYARATARVDDLQTALVEIGSLRFDLATAGRAGVTPPDAVFTCLGSGGGGTRRLLETRLAERVTTQVHVTVVRGRAARNECHSAAPTEIDRAAARVDLDVERLRRDGGVEFDVDVPGGPLVRIRVELVDARVVPA